jgi:poly-gamma-glutamate capsule biosynthesis protein CapA/YwtB (metallophosphatase superfamily)
MLMAEAQLHDLTALLKHLPAEDIPATADVLDASGLEAVLGPAERDRFHVLVAGDIMLGGRARRVLAEHGPEHPFRAVAPLLARADVVLGNLEGPLARHARREDRNYSYRVDPSSARTLARAGVGVVTLANNHLLDCGRAGVLETLGALRDAGVASVGAGATVAEAHQPAILEASGVRIAVLGYYWNHRTAARGSLPGSATDEPEWLEADIRRVRPHVDRIVVTFHWGVPYEREPSEVDRQKARLAIDLGADAVIGHHAHVIQPFEAHRGRPIFYGVGNFAFGSGNSKGEGLVVGLRFEPGATHAAAFPLYVKNRDPRVDYQPKVLAGPSGRRVLDRLARHSGEHGRLLRQENARAVVTLTWAAGPGQGVVA